MTTIGSLLLQGFAFIKMLRAPVHNTPMGTEHASVARQHTEAHLHKAIGCHLHTASPDVPPPHILSQLCIRPEVLL